MKKDAQWASQGKVILPLLQTLLSDPFFALPAPKSTGREYFNYGWLERQLARFPALRLRMFRLRCRSSPRCRFLNRCC